MGFSVMIDFFRKKRTRVDTFVMQKYKKESGILKEEYLIFL